MIALAPAAKSAQSASFILHYPFSIINLIAFLRQRDSILPKVRDNYRSFVSLCRAPRVSRAVRYRLNGTAGSWPRPERRSVRRLQVRRIRTFVPRQCVWRSRRPSPARLPPRQAHACAMTDTFHGCPAWYNFSISAASAVMHQPKRTPGTAYIFVYARRIIRPGLIPAGLSVCAALRLSESR